MENETLKELCQLAKWAGCEEDIEAVKGCLKIFKLEHRKNANLFRMCDEVDGIIYRRELDLKSIYESKSNY